VPPSAQGNKEALPRGCVQYMSAGTGVTHSVRWGGTLGSAGPLHVRSPQLPVMLRSFTNCRVALGPGLQEMNDGDATCRFLQLWITPNRRGHTPQYGSTRYDKPDRHTRLLRILGGTGLAPAWPGAHSPHSIALHADANIYVSESDPGTAFELSLGAGRQAYVALIEGQLDVNGSALQHRDGARVLGQADTVSALRLTAGAAGAHFLLVEMALGGRGRGEL
jgi:redox-sensitive bicupin YhaK (pirin superfamily)